MTLTIVEHNQPRPALYGALAAIVAQVRGASAMHLPASFDAAYKEAVQHVTADGALVASGLVWFERAGLMVSRARTPADIVNHARAKEIVVPTMAGVTDPGDVRDLFAAAVDAAIPVERIQVDAANDEFRLVNAPTAKLLDMPTYTRDCYGRLGVA